MFLSIYLANILTTITEGAYLVAVRKVIFAICALLMFRVISLFSYAVSQKTGAKICNAMSVDIMEQAFRISDKAYSEHNTSNFLRRIDGDPSTIYNNILQIIKLVSNVISSVAGVAYIMAINIYLGIIALVAVILTMIIGKQRKKFVKKNRKETYRLGEKTSSLLNEIVRSEKDIKSLNLENDLKVRAKKLYNDTAKQSNKTSIGNNAIWVGQVSVSEILSYVMLILALIFTDKGLITLASFMIVYSNRGYIRSLANCLAEFEDTFTAISLANDRINELYEDVEYPLERFGNRRIKNIKGNIAFKNVEFSYVEYNEIDREKFLKERKRCKRKKLPAPVLKREVKNVKKVFENLSFEIEANTSVAFVGKSGCGKSTILNLLSKMYEVDKGKVTIDGVDIKKLDKLTIRNSISLVNQFPYIFDMSIKENLLLACPNASDEDLERVISDSALDEFIKSLPDGLNTRVGESGIKLSGGQKQRLAIARALLRNSRIIMFDESTSSLDNIAQNQVKKSIDNIKGKSTIVIVAHRLTTIKDVDKIFYLVDGKIEDIGTFNELYKRNKSFKTMFLAENL